MMDTPKLPPHHMQWFRQMKLAAKNGDIALVSCLDAKTREQRSVLCILSQADDGGIEMIPLGHFVPEGNPYDAYLPPEG